MAPEVCSCQAAVASARDDGLGKHDGSGTHLDRDLVCVGVDVVGGEAADGSQVLRVEQEQQADDPVGGLECVVLQEAAGVAAEPARRIRHGAGALYCSACQ
jgi:hypothetical protein